MPEDVIELPEHGDAAGPADTAGEAGHAVGADGDVAPAPATLDHFLIDDTIAFIHRTVSEKALEAALLIGDYILTRYFNNDMEAAFSKDPHKSTSFNALCNHPDLRISRYKLVDMVKVAAQERFLRRLDDDFTGLHYSHRLKLTALPNNEIKIDMAKECVDENLTTRQLGYRIRRRVAETAPDPGEPGAEGEGETPTPGREPDPAADAVNVFIADL
ncbi:MAG: hypothetical protein C4548_06475, partial [Desulfobacteraceae bacterium]